MPGSDTDPLKDRADRLLVALGYFDSRAAAQAAIAAGGVVVDGAQVRKASQVISADSAIAAQPAHPWVSRGGIKLAHGLDVFGVEICGRHCLDIGASTGGFTDVLLSRGAGHVVAVDVGTGQLHSRLRADARVTCLESQDARALTAHDFGVAPSLLVCDASFIALEKLLSVPLALASLQADFVGLFKPQFQVGRDHVGKGGIVTDRHVSDAAAERFSSWMDRQGWPIADWTDSPITGGDGNAERLFWARRQPAAR